MKHKKVIGYIFNRDGYHSQPIYMDYNPETISTFIMRSYMSGGKILITDVLDICVIQTVPGTFFLDYCEDKEFLINELLPVLVPMQQGETEVPPLKADYSSSDYGSTDEEIKAFINKTFGTQL